MMIFDKQYEPLPGFLVKPNDFISNKMYGDNLSGVWDERCNYYIEINETYYNLVPEVRKDSPDEEVHIFSKPDTPSWQTVTIMHTPKVRTLPLENLVISKYNTMLRQEIWEMDWWPMVQLPEKKAYGIWPDLHYESIRLIELGNWPEFDRPRKLEQSLAFCHIFILKCEIFKDYILCARKGDFAWRLDCYIQSQMNSMDIHPADFAPPGFLFGSFRPLDVKG